MIFEIVSVVAFGLGVGAALNQRSRIVELKYKLAKAQSEAKVANAAREAELSSHQKTQGEFRAYRQATEVQVNAKRTQKQQTEVKEYVINAQVAYDPYALLYRTTPKF